MPRLYEFKNTKLANILNDRAVIYKEVGEINEQLFKLDKERKKLAYKMDRLKEKTKPFIDDLVDKIEMGEFEIISKVYLNKDGNPELEITDRIEEFKSALREEKKKNETQEAK